MTSTICRWGILGTAQIARKNWKAIRNSGNGIVTAVASRDPSRAEKFVMERQRECPFEPVPDSVTYQELLDRDDVDAVYIPLPTGLRKEWVLRAAASGKHILCEKPCALHARDLEEMLTACRAAGVQFMDGVMFMHSARLPLVRETLGDGTSVGRIRRIASQFSFRAEQDFLEQNIRVSSELEPFGSLGDLGWYCIRFVLWAFDGRLPREVTGRVLNQHGRSDSPAHVPLEFTAELLFDDGVSAGFFTSFLAENQQWVHVSGDKGALSIPDFVLPRFGAEVSFEVIQDVFQTLGCDFQMEHHPRRFAVREYSNSAPRSQEASMFRTFNRCVLEGRPDESWSEWAHKTQLVLDACLASSRQGGQPVQVQR